MDTLVAVLLVVAALVVLGAILALPMLWYRQRVDRIPDLQTRGTMQRVEDEMWRMRQIRPR